MKVYISADIEGITGITHWDETEKSKPDYQVFAKQMTREVKAACEGAISIGTGEIWVKDAHDTGRNIIASELPENVNLIRGWSGHPFLMIEGLDKSFDALIMIGYHSFGSSPFNPLSHTLNPTALNYVKLNGRMVSEFLIYTYAAATLEVPLVFISGDEGVCEEAKSLNKNIRTLTVNKGIGGSVISIHPELAIKEIRREVEEALKDDLNKYMVELPRHFKLELSFKDHAKAFKASFYPGAERISSTCIAFESDDYFEILRMLLFTT